MSSKPRRCPGNPGTAAKGTVAFSRADKSWTEAFELTELLDRILIEQGYETERHESWLVEKKTGVIFQPLLVELQPLEPEGVRTVTTIDASHSTLLPEGSFEFQHSSGMDVQASLARGFEQWAQLDLVVFLDALRAPPQNCTLLKITLPAGDDRVERERHAVLGPVANYAAKPQQQSDSTAEHDPFCPCCLFTHSYEAFQAQVATDATYCVRFYAMRDEGGVTEADCRINGMDWEEGARALCKYAKTWPDRGFEFRKQYIILHTYNTWCPFEASRSHSPSGQIVRPTEGKLSSAQGGVSAAADASLQL